MLFLLDITLVTNTRAPECVAGDHQNTQHNTQRAKLLKHTTYGQKGHDTNCELCSYSFTQASQACQIYVSHTGHNFCLLPTVEAISADICFCVDIPKMTSSFPQTENAIAMCLLNDFPRYLLLSLLPATFKIFLHTPFTHMFQHLCHLRVSTD